MVSKRLLISLILVLSLIVLISYRIFFRTVLSTDIIDIKVYEIEPHYIEVLQNNYHVLYNIDTETMKEVVRNPSDYRYIIYDFNFKNLSRTKRYYKLSIVPSFSKDFKNILVGYKKDDGEDGAFPTEFKPLSNFEFGKAILVKTSGYSDEQIKRLSEQNKFSIKCLTGNSLFDIGLNYQTVKAKL